MRAEYIDGFKNLITFRDKLLDNINEYNEKLDNAKEMLKDNEKQLEELCVVVTKEKLQQDKEKK